MDGCLHSEWDPWRDWVASSCLKVPAINCGMLYWCLVEAKFGILVYWDLKFSEPFYVIKSVSYLLQASILVLAFFSLSSSQPLVSVMSLRKMEDEKFKTMGQALGIPDSGLLFQMEPTPIIGPNAPFDKLLQDKRFRQSFMAFADRYSIP